MEDFSAERSELAAQIDNGLVDSEVANFQRIRESPQNLTVIAVQRPDERPSARRYGKP